MSMEKHDMLNFSPSLQIVLDSIFLPKSVLKAKWAERSKRTSIKDVIGFTCSCSNLQQRQKKKEQLHVFFHKLLHKLIVKDQECAKGLLRSLEGLAGPVDNSRAQISDWTAGPWSLTALI